MPFWPPAAPACAQSRHWGTIKVRPRITINPGSRKILAGTLGLSGQRLIRALTGFHTRACSLLHISPMASTCSARTLTKQPLKKRLDKWEGGPSGGSVTAVKTGHGVSQAPFDVLCKR